MRSEDLFYAIGMVDDKRLCRCEKQMNKSGNHRNYRSFKTVWLIAALVALMLCLAVSAGSALISMSSNKITTTVVGGDNKTDNPGETGENSDASEGTDGKDTYEGEIVHFDKEFDIYIELGNFYPQQIPEGYTMTYVTDGAPLQSQRIDYENPEGKSIQFWQYIADPASAIEIYGIVGRKQIKVNHQDGILYEQTGNTRTLVWIREDLGHGFALRTDDEDVDIVSLAESTAEGEPLIPSRAEQTVKAVEQLGDYAPGYLPEGYVERGTMGSPIEEGGGWYSYVRKWYINSEENSRIYFEYETYRIVTEKGYTDDARTACSFFIPGYHILKNIVVGEEVEINGMFGIADRRHIAWCDPEKHVVYHLYSKHVTGEDLLKVARSIVENLNSES